MAKKLTSLKAKEILHDKSVHGHPLTDKQRRFFGAIAGGAKPYENGGWLDAYPEAQNGIEGTMGGLTDKGFDYNGAWGGTMQMGGSLPGSAGFMYARTQSPAPSNGPYAKKTKASAQNGEEMKFYQEGLDWKPKTISKNGGWLDKFQEGGEKTYGTYRLPEVVVRPEPEEKGFWQQSIDSYLNENRDAGLLGALGSIVTYPLGLPQQAMMYGLTGKVQRPSEALGINNRYGALATDFAADPLVFANALEKAPGLLNKLSKFGKLSKEESALLKSIESPVVHSAGLPNPLSVVDKVIPRPPAPGQLIGMNDSWNNYSPLNLIPGYGRRLNTEGELFQKGITDQFRRPVLNENIIPQYSTSSPVGFRKFGNSISDVIESQTLRPKGTGIGSKQVMTEGNWAEPGKVNEQYNGVFEATMNPNVRGSDIKLERWNKRNGIVATTTSGDVAIPITDPGLSFNRRLPFSNRYVSIDKEKLMNDQFQLATQLPYLQSLAEKYGIWAGGAGALGYGIGGEDQAKKNIDFINRYTIDPLVSGFRQFDNSVNSALGTKSLLDSPKKSNGGWLNKYDDGGIIEDDMGQWAHPGEITKINSNQITMQGVDYPVLGISDTGDTKMMQPGKDYKFKGKSVTELPMMQEGGEMIKVKQPDGSFKTYNTNSEEYRKLYDSGNLMNYDKSTDTYFAKPLDEVVITGQAPEKGFWEQYKDDLTRKHNSGILDAVLGTPMDALFGLPQRAMMYGLTGKVQDPSEALDIENPLLAFGANAIADPTNLLGIGLADDALRLSNRASKLLSEGRLSQAIPKASLLGDVFKPLTSIGKETAGYLFNNKANKQAIAEGNQWLQNWIQNPATQAKIEKDLGYVNQRSNTLKDIYDLGYEQAKTFTPMSKEFPISRQLYEGAMHDGNLGISYMYDLDPYQRSIPKFVNDPYAGSWISRSPTMSQADRTFTTVHEGTHDWTSDWLLNTSGQKDYLLSDLDPKVRSDWEIWRNNPEKFEKDFGKKAAYQAYLADPTEQHARIMELRKYFNLTPEQTITPEDAQNMINKLNLLPSKKRPIDVRGLVGFLNKIDNDPTKLSNRFNRLWATAPYIAPIAGAASIATQKEQKNGGWLNKYE